MMNRAERRQMKRKDLKREKREAHVKTRYEEGYEAGVKAGREMAMFEMSGWCLRMCITSTIAILKSEWKFGAIRILRFLKLYYAQLSDLLNGTVSEPKLRKWIKDTTGVDLDEHTGANRLDIMKEWQESA